MDAKKVAAKKKKRKTEEEEAAPAPEPVEGVRVFPKKKKAVKTSSEPEPPKKKKKKKEKKEEEEEEPEPEPEPEEEEEEEDDDDEEEEEEESGEKAAAKKLRKTNRKRKISGYRSKARECGYGKVGGVVCASGIDAHRALLSANDARKVIQFLPDNEGCNSYTKAEFAQRMKAAKESISGAALREAQARLDAVMRAVTNDATLRTVEAGKFTVNTAAMHSALRRYSLNTAFTSVLPPKGLLKHAQTSQILDASVEDAEMADADEAEAKANQKELEQLAKERDRAKQKRAANKKAKSATKVKA